MFDYLLTNAVVIDGSGGPSYAANIGISDGKISAIAPCAQAEANNLIDLEGRILTPGFIDIHRHADAALFRPGFGTAELCQGITTIINGNCGLSIAPLPSSRREEILNYLQPVTGSLPEDVEFEGFSGYAALLKQRDLPLNIGMLAGSGTMRTAVCGYRDLDNTSLKQLHKVLEDALYSGVFGVSVGLAYMPDNFYTPSDLALALAPISGSGIPLVFHLRAEGRLLYESVIEAIQAVKLLNVPLHISHFKCIGRKNWGRVLGKTIELIEQSRQDGIGISCDVYPWTAGSTQMASLLPPEFLQGGPSQTTLRLLEPKQREICRDIMSRPGADFENIVESMGWQSIFVSGLRSEKNSWCIGKNIEEIAIHLGKDPFDAALNLLAEENCNVTMVDYIACEEDIETILRLSYSSVISDTIYAEGGLPHPRGYGNTAMLFNEYVKKRSTLTMEQMIHKLTALPAKTMGIKNKGLIKEGFDADILVIEKEGISSEANYQNPCCLSKGIYLAMVNGKVALKKSTVTNAKNGSYIGR